jgi:hypothetical protein
MKLRCLLGSISCDGVLAEKGDEFEVGDKAGAGLVASGYAVEIEDVPKAEPTKKDTDEEVVSFVPPVSGDVYDPDDETPKDVPNGKVKKAKIGRR